MKSSCDCRQKHTIYQKMILLFQKKKKHLDVNLPMSALPPHRAAEMSLQTGFGQNCVARHDKTACNTSKLSSSLCRSVVFKRDMISGVNNGVLGGGQNTTPRSFQSVYNTNLEHSDLENR